MKVRNKQFRVSKVKNWEEDRIGCDQQIWLYDLHGGLYLGLNLNLCLNTPRRLHGAYSEAFMSSGRVLHSP